MPHQCTSCGNVFADGSKEMLSGCPDCGGTKFQFHPEGADIPEEPPGDAEPPDPPSTDDSVAGTVGNAAATVKDLVGRGGSDSRGRSGPSETPGPDDTTVPGNDPPSASTDSNVAGVALETEGSTADPSVQASAADEEDAAQASARTDVVNPDELPETDRDDTATPESTEETASPPPSEGTVVDEPDGSEPDDRPDLEELRKELNEQFESIKVVSPGHYELNLMELYDREEYIIALQEDGKYTIQVPDRWQE